MAKANAGPVGGKDMLKEVSVLWMSKDMGNPWNRQSQKLPDWSILSIKSPLNLCKSRICLYKLNDLLNSICLLSSDSFQTLLYQSRIKKKKTFLFLKQSKPRGFKCASEIQSTATKSSGSENLMENSLWTGSASPWCLPQGLGMEQELKKRM